MFAQRALARGARFLARGYAAEAAPAAASSTDGYVSQVRISESEEGERGRGRRECAPPALSLSVFLFPRPSSSGVSIIRGWSCSSCLGAPWAV
jgi:hypothetical protein